MLLLGAGASLSAGCSSGGKIIEDVVAQLSPRDVDVDALFWDDKVAKFYNLLDNLSRTDRYLILEPHIRGESPSLGYCCVAELVKAGYFDVIFSSNFDVFMEDALADVGLRARDFTKLIVGKHEEDEIIQALDSHKPRIKLIKLHGDLPARILAFTREETFQFSPKITGILEEYLSKDIIICGHSMRDYDINRCIQRQGGTIWYINPSRPEALCSIETAMRVRKSTDEVISGEEGKFDDFFAALYHEFIRMDAISLAAELVKTEKDHNLLYALKEVHDLLHDLQVEFDTVKKKAEQGKNIEEQWLEFKQSLSEGLERIEKTTVDDGLDIAARKRVKDCLQRIEKKRQAIDEVLKIDEKGAGESKDAKARLLKRLVDGFPKAIAKSLHEAAKELEDMTEDLRRRSDKDLRHRSDKLDKDFQKIENRVGEEGEKNDLRKLIRYINDFVLTQNRLVEWMDLHARFKNLDIGFPPVRKSILEKQGEQEEVWSEIYLYWDPYQESAFAPFVAFETDIRYIDKARRYIDDLRVRGSDVTDKLNKIESMFTSLDATKEFDPDKVDELIREIRNLVEEFGELLRDHFVSTDTSLKETAERLKGLFRYLRGIHC